MIPQRIHKSWHPYLEPLFNDPKAALLRGDILMKEKFYPEKENIFRVFEMPLDKIKVVILGQDPYTKVGQANGLAFAVNKDIEEPPSLKVIKREIDREEVDTLTKANENFHWRELLHWHYQGVFLLNTALTVRAGESGSHVSYWQFFTREVVRIISVLGENPVWMMWGSKAKGYIGLVHGFYKWNKTYKGPNYNYILEADHPAAETYGGKYKFTGCGHFAACNEILSYKNQKPIQW